MARIGLAAVAAFLVAGTAAAQQQQPAEFPPSDFTGNQFVDSAGCAFIRAGVGGAVNWVPRMSRARSPLCNFEPTFPPGVAGPAPRPLVASLDAPIIEITPPPAEAAPEPAPVASSIPSPVAGPIPSPVALPNFTPDVGPPIATVASIPATAAPAPVAPPEPEPAVTITSLADACDGRFGVQPGFVSASTGEAIDCGPAPQPADVASPQVIAPAPAPAQPSTTLAQACEGRFGVQPGFVSARTGEPINCGPAPQVAAAAPVVSPQIIAPPPEPARPSTTLAQACEGRFGVQPGFVSAQTGEPIDCGPATQIASAAPTAAVAPGPLRMTLAQVCEAQLQNPTTRYVRPDGSPIVCEAPAPVAVASAAPLVAPSPVALPAPSQVATAAACPNSPYLQSVDGLPVRCGPQTVKPYTIASSPAARAGVAADGQRISTSGVGAIFAPPPVPASNPVRATRQAAPVSPPPGYEKVWTDGRINPQRGIVQRAAPAPAATQARVSTRTVAPQAVRAPSAYSGHRYVQVGTFGEPANATRMIQRLAGMGFPVATGKSGNLQIIAAGPFGSAADLNRALQTVRGMGFADAYTRN